MASGGDISPVADRIGQLLRLLSSPVDGEVVAAARALGRTLKSVNADFHVLAARIDRPETEIKRIYDTGFADGLAAAETSEVSGGTCWHDRALWCQQRADHLSEYKRDFLKNVARRTIYREPTEKEEKFLRSIFIELGGRF